MFNLPFKHTDTSNKFLTVDISSTDVKVAAFYLDEGKLKVIGTGRETLTPNTVKSGEVVDINNLEKSLEIAIHQAQLNSEETINQVVFGVSGDLSLGLMTTAKFTRPNETVISEKEIEDTYNKIVATASNQAAADILEITGNPDIDLELVTSSLAYTKVDDKRVDSAIGLNGTEVELAVFTAFTKTTHSKNLQKIARDLKLKIVAIGSNMFSFSKCLNVSKNQYIDAVLMDIGADATDVAIVFGGAVVTTKSLPIGNAHFTEEIAGKMGLTTAEAGNVRKTYCAGKLAQSETMVVQHCLEEVTELWISGLEILFAEFTGVKTFAPTLYITGEGSEIPDIVESLNMTPWTRSIAFKAPPVVSPVSARDFTNIHDLTGNIGGMGWTLPISLGAIFEEVTMR